jgi:hypothetical protein
MWKTYVNHLNTGKEFDYFRGALTYKHKKEVFNETT